MLKPPPKVTVVGALPLSLEASNSLRLSYCTLCKTQFASVASYRSHLQVQHPTLLPPAFFQPVAYNGRQPPSLHTCSDCNATFATGLLLKRHWRQHYAVYQYLCEQCQRRFKDETSLTLHACKFHRICPYCTQRVHARHFARHLAIHRPTLMQDAGISCTSVTSASGINSSYAMRDLSETSLVLPIDESLAHSSPMKQRAALFAKNIEDLQESTKLPTGVKHAFLQCPFCYERFQQMTAFNDHVRSQICRKYFQCHICSQRLGSRQAALRHEIMHDPNAAKHGCTSCGRKFQQQSNLKRHELRVHVGVPDFTCSTCCKRFTSAERRADHEAVAHSVIYVCEKCSRKFTSLEQMRSHSERIHLPEYLCALCQRRYKRERTLRTHFAKAHPEEVALLNDKQFLDSMAVDDKNCMRTEDVGLGAAEYAAYRPIQPKQPAIVESYWLVIEGDVLETTSLPSWTHVASPVLQSNAPMTESVMSQMEFVGENIEDATALPYSIFSSTIDAATTAPLASDIEDADHDQMGGTDLANTSLMSDLSFGDDILHNMNLEKVNFDALTRQIAQEPWDDASESGANTDLH